MHCHAIILPLSLLTTRRPITCLPQSQWPSSMSSLSPSQTGPLLTGAACSILSAISCLKNTLSSYSTTHRRHTNFCQCSTAPAYPVSENTLCQFSSFLGQQHLKHQTISLTSRAYNTFRSCPHALTPSSPTYCDSTMSFEELSPKRQRRMNQYNNGS